MGLFTDFERGEDLGVQWSDFVTAVGVYVYVNEKNGEPTIACIARAFNTTPDLVREAVEEHPWLYSDHDDDPQLQTVGSDGE